MWLICIALAAWQEHLAGCVSSIVLPRRTTYHYELFCADDVAVAVYYDLLGLTDGAFVGMAYDQCVDALYGVAKSFVAVYGRAGIDSSACAVRDCKGICRDRIVAGSALAYLYLQKCYIFGVVVLQIQLAHDVAHYVLVCILGGASFMVAGYRAEYLILDWR